MTLLLVKISLDSSCFTGEVIGSTAWTWLEHKLQKDTGSKNRLKEDTGDTVQVIHNNSEWHDDFGE